MRVAHLASRFRWVIPIVSVLVVFGMLSPVALLAQEPDLAQMRAELAQLRAKVEELAAKLAALENAQAAKPPAEAKEPEKKEAAKPAGATVSVGEKGFSLQSADGDFQLRLRALLQTDGRFYADDAGLGAADSFLIRRARIELAGTLYKKLQFRILPDYSGNATTLVEAWLEWAKNPALRFQLGKIKLPVGLERSQSSENRQFAETGYVTALVPNRDLGVSVLGTIAEGRLDYYAGVFNGTTDGGTGISDGDDDKSVAVHLFTHPFANSKHSALEGLGLGIGATWGDESGTPAGYRTLGQQTFYSWRSGVVDDGSVQRVVPQGYWFVGPFGVLAEVAISEHEVRSAQTGGVLRKLESSASNLALSWVLTGEAASLRGVKPAKTSGAWQLSARYTELDVDDDAFPLFADPARSAEEARTLGLGLSWYLNPQVRFFFDYYQTELETADDALLEHDDERVTILRAQYRF